jgi:DNA-binding transcriptional LysR family regulator
LIEGGSFVKAAGLLEPTDSGVGRAIKRLATRLDVRLLGRTTRSVAGMASASRSSHSIRRARTAAGLLLRQA